MAHKVATILAMMVGLALAAPQYGYEPPQEPTSLYETPVETIQEPVQLYEVPDKTEQVPDLVGEPQELVPDVVDPPQMEGMPYAFQWQVEDQETSNTFNHVESSDGLTTQGEYRVLLPDGRTQVVKFFDDGSGFNAEVSYEK